MMRQTKLGPLKAHVRLEAGERLPLSTPVLLPEVGRWVARQGHREGEEEEDAWSPEGDEPQRTPLDSLVPIPDIWAISLDCDYRVKRKEEEKKKKTSVSALKLTEKQYIMDNKG